MTERTSLEKLAEEILKDGKIDAGEVAELKTLLYADGMIDKEEAEILFKLNDGASGAANAPAWADFFVEAITKFLLEDEVSPGVVDDVEAKWLISHIESDSVYDDVEKKLLANLKVKAKQLPALLVDKINKVL